MLKSITIRYQTWSGLSHDHRIAHRSLFSFQRLVLGGVPADSSRFVVTEYDPEHALLHARNSFVGEFADGVAFAAAVLPEEARLAAYSGDRLDRRLPGCICIANDVEPVPPFRSKVPPGKK